MSEKDLKDYVEYLISIFPKSSKANAEDFRQTLVDIFENEQYCQKISDRLHKRLEDFFPYPTREQWEDMSDDEKYCRVYMDENSLIYQWSKDVESFFVKAKGPRRKYEEACELAADTWMERLFETMMQDNGDRSGHSDTMQILGAMLKINATDGISDDVKNKVRENLVNYYKNHCKYTFEDGTHCRVELYCDYGPNSPMYDILKNAGVPENDIRSICPWKTGVEIDSRDNAVILVGYQKREYI